MHGVRGPTAIPAPSLVRIGSRKSQESWPLPGGGRGGSLGRR